VTERERRTRVVDYLSAGKVEEAAGELAGSREPYPGDDILHHSIGMALASRGTLDAAHEQLEAAARLSPNSAQIRSDLAQICLAEGDAEGAISVAQEALALDPGSALAHFTLGRACFSAECARQSRRGDPQERDCDFALIDGRTPGYLRAQQELEAALYADPPFIDAVRTTLSFAYMRAGHYHAAAEQLSARLEGLPPGEEADQTETRLRYVHHEIARERYWDPDAPDVSQLQQTARAPGAPAECKLRLAHAYSMLGDRDEARSSLAEARAAGYAPCAATVCCTDGRDRDCRELADVHVLIAGGLECIVDDTLRFLPFADIQVVSLGPEAPWRTAEVLLRSGEQLEATVPTLYRFSVRSANDLVQSARFAQFKYDPGENRYAWAIGTRSLTAEDGSILFSEIRSILFH
jgi:tetratricopeptide (TPR) repeat protein